MPRGGDGDDFAVPRKLNLAGSKGFQPSAWRQPGNLPRRLLQKEKKKPAQTARAKPHKAESARCSSSPVRYRSLDTNLAYDPGEKHPHPPGHLLERNVDRLRRLENLSQGSCTPSVLDTQVGDEACASVPE